MGAPCGRLADVPGPDTLRCGVPALSRAAVTTGQADGGD
jgi:hypothetical protein